MAAHAVAGTCSTDLAGRQGGLLVRAAGWYEPRQKTTALTRGPTRRRPARGSGPDQAVTGRLPSAARCARVDPPQTGNEARQGQPNVTSPADGGSRAARRPSSEAIAYVEFYLNARNRSAFYLHKYLLRKSKYRAVNGVGETGASCIHGQVATEKT